MIPLLLLRPQPGNDASAARAREMGLSVVQLPFFEIVGERTGPAPSGPFDALLLTSANAARYGADLLAAFAETPAYAVGEASAQAARAAGRDTVILGGGDAGSTAAKIAGDGHRAVLHIHGVDLRPFDPHGLNIAGYVVYRSAERAEEQLRLVLDQLGRAVAAVHSPRAGARLNRLLTPAQRGMIDVAAISPAAAQAAGSGWASLAVSAAPDDTALLARAESLCIRAG